MPYSNIPAGYGLLRFHWTTGAGRNEAVNILGVQLTGTPTAALVASTAGGLWKAGILNPLSSHVTFTSTDAVVNNGGVLSAATDTTNNGPGGQVDNPVQVNACIVVRKNTVLLGKHYRGRLYIPGLNVGKLDSSFSAITSAGLSTLQTAWNSFLTSMQGGTVISNVVLLHKLTSITPTTVSSFTVESLLGSQRRRLRKAPHR